MVAWRRLRRDRATITGSKMRTAAAIGSIAKVSMALPKPRSGSCMASSHDSLCRAAGHQSFQLSARRVVPEGTRGDRRQPGAERDRHCRPQHVGGGRARASGGQGCGIAPADRRTAGFHRHTQPALLPGRPGRLWPPVADADRRQDAVREGAMHADHRRPVRLWRRPAPDRTAGRTARPRLRRPFEDAEAAVRQPALSGRAPSLSRRRCQAAGQARRPVRCDRRAFGRHQRRPCPCRRPPAPCRMC